jgi:hypothetical protein
MRRPARAQTGELPQVLEDGMAVVEKINADYRERPQQGLIQSRGGRYLQAEFPQLDYITLAAIVSSSSG